MPHLQQWQRLKGCPHTTAAVLLVVNGAACPYLAMGHASVYQCLHVQLPMKMQMLCREQLQPISTTSTYVFAAECSLFGPLAHTCTVQRAGSRCCRSSSSPPAQHTSWQWLNFQRCVQQY